MRRLETAVNVAILVTCVAVVSVLGHRFLLAERPGSSGSRPPVLAAGESIAQIGDFKLREAERTLLMFLRSSCKFCEESVPFYHRLIREVERQRPGRIQLTVITADSPETASEYIKVNNLSAANLITLSPQVLGKLKVFGTPTLVLVDSGGTVQRVWLGKLDTAREAEVLQALLSEGRAASKGAH